MQQREFDLYLQRARKFQERLSRHLFFETIPLTAEVRHSVEPVPFAERLNGEFRPIREGEKWGDSWDSGWFRLTAELPQEWAGRPLALRIGLGGEAMLFDEAGVPKFGFSRLGFRPPLPEGVVSIAGKPGGENRGILGGSRRQRTVRRRDERRSGAGRAASLREVRRRRRSDADRMVQPRTLAADPRP